MKEKTYIAIDLKSFYASVECVERGLDPLSALLVVADNSRTDKTICLAVSPALKAYGIPGRPRLFEVIQKTRNTGIEYIVAPPRMALYIDYSRKIYNVYTKHISPEDIHVYSVDEVFIDATSYLNIMGLSPHDLTMMLIQEVLKETGITATAGIGTNLYLAKIAMDIVAKHIPPDKDGVRIASLDERSYREKLWDHRPLTDFWRVGKGYAKKLLAHGIETMGDVCLCSLGKADSFYNEDLLYKLFGVNAQLLIDHAWGYEPVSIKDIKSYRPQANSLTQGQVLTCPYTNSKARIVLKEMAEELSLDLLEKSLVTDQLTLTVGYDIENLSNPEISKNYDGPIRKDHYGRLVPEHSHGSYNLASYSCLSDEITDGICKIFDEKVNPLLLIRRLNITANRVIPMDEANTTPKQLDFFSNANMLFKTRESEEEKQKKEKSKRLQEAQLKIKKRYGKNAILKGSDFLEGATARERNAQIGGHKA